MPSLILEVVEGPNAGRQVQLTTALQIGRDEGAELVLAEPQVSRYHVRVSPVADGAIIEDLGSTNGTFVNGNEIHAPTLVQAGDQLLVGTSVLLVRSQEQVANQPSAVRPIPPALAAPPQRPDYIPAGVAKEASVPELDPLLDARTKAKAKIAPLAVFLLVVLAVLVYLATR